MFPMSITSRSRNPAEKGGRGWISASYADVQTRLERDEKPWKENGRFVVSRSLGLGVVFHYELVRFAFLDSFICFVPSGPFLDS